MPDQLKPNVSEPTLENTEPLPVSIPTNSAEHTLIESANASNTERTEAENNSSTTERSSWVDKLRGHKAIVAIGVAVLAICLTAGIKSLGNNSQDKEVPIIPTGTSESFVPTETESSPEVVNDYTKTVENIVEGYNFSSLTPEQQSEIKGYESMGLDEFQSLSQEEQSILGDWVVTNFMPHYDFMLEANKIDLHYTEDAKTPEEILGNYAYLTSMCLGMIELNEDGNGSHTNVELGQKVIGAMRDTVTEIHLESGSDWVLKGQEMILIADIDLKVIISKENSDGSIIINTLWSSTDTISVEPGAEFSQKTFIPFSSTDIYGNSKNRYLRSWAVGKDDVTYIDIG